MIASVFIAEVRRSHRKNKEESIILNTRVFTISITDIKKVLKPRERSDPIIKLLVKYYKY